MKVKKLLLTVILIIAAITLTGCGETREEAEKEIAEYLLDDDKWDSEMLDVKATTACNVPIPKGFKHLENTTKEEGLVIIDNNTGDEFVWVPLDLILTNSTDSLKTDFLSKYFNEDYREELDPNLIKSVKQYGGFYVSRNEMLATKDAITNNYANIDMRSDGKRRNISYATAKDESEQMYMKSDSVVSHLMYGSEWDAIMAWYSSTGTYISSNTTDIGLYRNSDFATTTNREILVLIFRNIDVTIKGSKFNLANETEKEALEAKIKVFKNVMNPTSKNEFSETLLSLANGRISNINVTFKDCEDVITDEMFFNVGDSYALNIGHIDVENILLGYLLAGNTKYTDIIIYHPGMENILTCIDDKTYSTNSILKYKTIYTVPSNLDSKSSKLKLISLFFKSLMHIAQLDTYDMEDTLNRYQNLLTDYDSVEAFDEVYKQFLTEEIPEEMFYTYYQLNSLEEIDQKTNKNMIKNIKGMAGGLAEWTQEEYVKGSTDYNVVRGGSYQNSGNGDLKMHRPFPASKRQPVDTAKSYENIGFRVCLYITPTDVKHGEVKPPKEEDKEVLNELVSFIDKDGKTVDVPIPKGFIHVGGTKNTGFVIQDVTNKNLQYVWVPIDENKVLVQMDTALEKAYTECNKVYEKKPKTTTTVYEEGFEIEALNKSINRYHGFYVSQAEMGYDNNGDLYNLDRASLMTDYFVTTGNYFRDTKPSYDKGLILDFTNDKLEKTSMQSQGFELTYDKAVGISKAIYSADNTYNKNKEATKSVVSHLLYGAEWDAICLWLLESNLATNTATNANGNKVNTIIADSSSIGKYKSSNNAESYYLSKSLNNICGLAGNLAELTQERYAGDNGTEYVIRGGSFASNGNEEAIASRRFVTSLNYDPNSEEKGFMFGSIGFRTALYITVPDKKSQSTKPTTTTNTIDESTDTTDESTTEPDSTDSTNELKGDALKLFNAINEKRRLEGLNVLKLDSEVTKVAEKRVKKVHFYDYPQGDKFSKIMKKNDKYNLLNNLAGNGFSTDTLEKMLSDSGIIYTECVENIANILPQENNNTHSSVINTNMPSDNGKEKNLMLSRNYTHIGIGTAYNGRTGILCVNIY